MTHFRRISKILAALLVLSGAVGPGMTRIVHAGSISNNIPVPVEIMAQVGHTQPVKGIQYSRSGRFIVTWAGDSKLKLWTNDGRLIRTIKVPGDPLECGAGP